MPIDEGIMGYESYPEPAYIRGKKVVSKGKMIYVAGAYTASSKELIKANVRLAIDAGEELLKAGFAPIVPHLFHYWDEVYPHGYETWMELDITLLTNCHALVRLEGISRGADREVAIAIERKIPVFFGVETFLSCFK